jgi:hypothetical protein
VPYIQTLHDKITLYATSLNTKNDLVTPSSVANLSQGGFRYDCDVDSWNLFKFSVPLTSWPMSLQFLHLRQVFHFSGK